MTGTVDRPQLDLEIGALKRRVTDLERILRRRDGFPPPEDIVDLAGPLYVTELDDCPVYPCASRRNYWEAVITLANALDSGTLTLVLYVNGVSTHTFAVPAGITKLVYVVDISCNIGDRLQVRITDEGVGGSSVLLALRY